MTVSKMVKMHYFQKMKVGLKDCCTYFLSK
jgi:hypothetical protein